MVSMKAKPDIAKSKLLTNETWIMLGVCLATFLCFSHIMFNEFLYWDDNAFIVNNAYIRRFSWENIKYLFSHEFGANWQPLTMLSYSLNYYLSKLSPGGYFLTGLLLHTANTALVFYIIKKILLLLWNKSRDNERLIMCAIVALWFGIHPMHVESVGWLFERKDVLYTFFYLFGLDVYLNYLISNKQKWLVLAFVFFVLSCLSKPMAVVFPLTLIVIDFLLNRKFNNKLLIEKVPFLIISVIMGYVTVRTQSSQHAFGLIFPFFTKIGIASYSFLAYIGKLFIPINLCGFYPYSFLPGQPVPFLFYITPFMALALVGLPLYVAYQKNKTYFRVICFGYGFYLVNIALVLQFFAVGFAIISDRYSYMSYIGLFFMIVYFLNELYVKADTSIKNLIQGAVIAFTIVLAYLGYERTLAWQNTETMLTDVIKQYPGKVPQAYKYLGTYYGRKGRVREAYNCYYTLINNMHEGDASAYNDMGSVYMSMGKMDSALKYLTTSLRLDSNAFMPYYNLGRIYANNGDYQKAFAFYNRAQKIFSTDENLIYSMGLAYVATKQYSNAIASFNFLIRLSPDNSFYYFNRGVTEYDMNDVNGAIADFEKTVAMPGLPENSSSNLRGIAAHNLSIIYKDKGDNGKASYYESAARQFGFNPSQ